MPTSVLLAVLAAAGLLALAPALVRRYDATERLVAERAMSTARVIERQRRRRTVPGRYPVNPPRSVMLAGTGSSSETSPVPAAATEPSPATPAAPAAQPAPPAPASPPAPAAPLSSAAQPTPASAAPTPTPAAPAPVARPAAAGARSPEPAAPSETARAGRASLPPPRRRPRTHTHHTPAIYRRRRVLAALVLLNTSELCGVGLVGPGFWIGSAPSLCLLAAYVVHLRRRAIAERQRRREAARRAARLAARQAELRREQARRLAARREALRRAAAARAVAQRESQRLSQRYVDGSARGPLRGRAYEARAAGY